MFCPECGSLLRSKKNASGELILYCPEHGEITGKEIKLRDSVKKKEKRIILPSEKEQKEAEESKLTAKEVCPKCGNNEAYVEIVQTRSADEAPTRFLTCKKCGHKWREYS